MAGIYLHIPFCKKRCSYCDFHFSTTFENYRKQLIDALCEELIQRKDYLASQQVETIYFGGGTPSLLSSNEFTRIIETIQDNYSLTESLEVSLEANPDDITPENLSAWKNVGFNRLSIGIQSFKSSDLEWMNRAHTVDQSQQCVSLAQKAGFTNITVDLMYGLPNLTLEEWKAHIQHVIDLGVPHISAYCLTVEEKTALNKWVESGKIQPAGEDQQSDQFLTLLSALENAGYEQYEISNFAQPTCESKHNSNYWKGKWYLGIGPSAHSFNGTTRSWNIANNTQYIKGITEGNRVFEEEILSNTDQFNERILTGLRTTYGVSLQELNSISTLTNSFHSELETFIKNGFMESQNGHLRLTKKGRLQADFIASELFI